ncbi:hypothetical protein AB7813_12845 [Tardiphaga sp. 20_F10_N6_6]|uniref:hypothetical protein n=1 Tax=Tardiphaga sp. 20_F10_N6_6 TaxID=3240788 RepID=UPI003F88843E
MFSAKHTIVAALVVMSSSCLAQQGKRDIRGLAPGMSFVEAGRVVKEKGYSCNNFTREAIPYGIMCEGLTLWFSTVLDGAPLIGLNMDLRTTASVEEIAQSLSDQFSTKPATTPTPSNAEYSWDLGDGKVLLFLLNQRRVILHDDVLAKKDHEERFQRSRVPIPKL